jgi:hypothetical protein
LDGPEYIIEAVKLLVVLNGTGPKVGVVRSAKGPLMLTFQEAVPNAGPERFVRKMK